MSVSFCYRPIGEIVADVASWNPLRDGQDRLIRYIDLSSVSRDTKVIELNELIVAREAPSRARQLVQTGDVLVSTVRPNLNGVARVPETFDGSTASTGFCVLRPKDRELDSGYLFHWVKAPMFIADMVRKATGASYPAVSDRTVMESLIPLPPLAEQRRLAAILDQAEALRAKRQHALAQLDVLTQSFFLDLFGDPVSNPKHWPTAQLGDVIHSATDGPHVSPAYTDAGVPFVSARHIRRGEVLWTDLKFISAEDALVHWRKCKPERGDILYTKGGTTGIAKAIDFDQQIALWVHVALLKTNRNKVDPLWLENMLNSDFCYLQSQRLTHGIANRDLGLKRMVRIQLYLPPLFLQREFAVQVSAVERVKASQRASLAKLDVLFASLQHRAFRGEL